MFTALVSYLWKRRVVVLAAALAVTLTFIFWPRGTKVVTTQPLPNTIVSVVERPVLTIKEIDKIVTDPVQQKLINSLMIENKALKLEVTSLTSTVATLNTKGGVGINEGTIREVVDAGNSPKVAHEPTPAGNLASHDPSKSFNFKDFQLNAVYSGDGTGFRYDLSQAFTIVTTTGKGKDGHPLSLVKLFQTTPSGQAEISSKTTEVFADPSAPGWHVNPRIHGGVGINDAGHYGGVVAFQWLTFGSTKAAEDSRFAILSPAVGITKASKDLGLLPISFNLGRIKHNPLSNTWFSPTIDLNKRVGVAITATF